MRDRSAPVVELPLRPHGLGPGATARCWLLRILEYL